MSILEKTGGSRWKAEEKDRDKMCDTVSVRVTCCGTFQYSALFIGQGLEIAAWFFTPMLCCVAEWQTQSHPSPLACFVYTRHNGIRGEKLFGGSQQQPFLRPK